jgi:hypothetical protein
MRRENPFNPHGTSLLQHIQVSWRELREKNLNTFLRISQACTSFQIIYMPQCRETYEQNVGRLKDGTRYIVYRMLLYCDDFNRTR